MDDATLKQFLAHEGERLKPYKDSRGILTIGIGRNLEANGISREESRYLFGNDITDADAKLCGALPWVLGLDPVRQRVLLDMAFNMGIVGLLGFKNMLAAAQRGDWAVASLEMLDSKWADQVGQRAQTLAGMMRTGVDPFA